MDNPRHDLLHIRDDGNIDPYRDIPDPREFHLCGGVYNNDTSWLNSGGDANPRTWNGGDYCRLQNLVVNGGVVAQGGFDLSLRDLRDDNNSSYNGISPSGKGNPHPPTPAEAFNFDPSFLYFFTKQVGNSPLFAEGKTTIKEDRP